MRRRLLIAVLATLLGSALIPPAAHGATQVRRVQVEVPGPTSTPPTPAGTLSLDFVFKNKRATKRKFTPRQLTRIDFSQVPLHCFGPGSSTSILLFHQDLRDPGQGEEAAEPERSQAKSGPLRIQFRPQLRRLHGHDQWGCRQAKWQGRPDVSGQAAGFRTSTRIRAT
jgi:hypothetical protein